MAGDGQSSSDNVNAEKDFSLVVLTAIVILLFMYTKVIQNRKYWIYMECVIGCICAAAFMSAGILASNIMKKTDGMITYLFRLISVAIISQAAAFFLSKDSVDQTVRIAVSISTLLSRGPVLLMMASLPRTGKDLGTTLDERYVYGFTFFILLLVAGNLYHIATSKTRNYSHRTVGDPVSLHLSVDALVTFLLGAFILGFPDMFFSLIRPTLAATGMHLHCAKTFGLLLLGGSILSFASLSYHYDSDAVGTLKVKLMIYLSTELLALTGIIIDSQLRTFGHAAVMLGAIGGLAFNAGNAIYKHEMED